MFGLPRTPMLLFYSNKQYSALWVSAVLDAVADISRGPGHSFSVCSKLITPYSTISRRGYLLLQPLLFLLQTSLPQCLRAIRKEEILTGILQELSKDLNKKPMCYTIFLRGMFELWFDIPRPVVMWERLITLKLVSFWRTSKEPFISFSYLFPLSSSM